MSDNRDWQADMKDIQTWMENKHWVDMPHPEQTLNGEPLANIILYWLQQYAELEKEQAYAKKQAIMWNDKAVAEKSQADYWREATRQGNIELEAAEAREKKLKEAIEAAINEKAQWGDAGNALDVVVRYLSETLSTLYPKETTE